MEDTVEKAEPCYRSVGWLDISRVCLKKLQSLVENVVGFNLQSAHRQSRRMLRLI